ncbi:MAG: YfcE family phosphodiesterase [Ruminococcaceae bacterium]|nr:YfcE family phosphodiesterase [Oscillospiraceae bacterium]
MKILVFSDSHGAYSKMESAVRVHPDADMIFFLGDGLRDADRLFDELRHIPHVAVKGNCDIASSFGGESYLDEQTVDLGGVRIFSCHGHKYGVKSSELNLWLRAKEKDAALALFGHTHEPFERYYEGVRLFNPGSIGMGSYGVIYIEKGAVVASHGKV